MSVHLFPNADGEKMERFAELLRNLFKNNPNPDKVEEIIEHISYAHKCSIMEAILESSELRNLHTFNPVIVREIEDVLLECR